MNTACVSVLMHVHPLLNLVEVIFMSRIVQMSNHYFFILVDFSKSAITYTKQDSGASSGCATPSVPEKTFLKIFLYVIIAPS